MSRHTVSLLIALMFAACATAGDVPDSPDASGDDTPDSGGDPTFDAAGPTIDAPDISAPDADLTCPTQPCDLLDQCGCGANQACDLDGNNLETGGTICRAVTASGDELDTCASGSECAAGFVCIGNPGRCRRYCDDNGDCPGDGGLCVINLSYNGNPIPGAVTCSTHCDPIANNNNGCPATWGCHLYSYDPDGVPGNGDEMYLSDCDAPPANGGGVGSSCSGSGDCLPGNDCVTINGSSSCRPTCLCPGGNCGSGSCPGGSGSCYGYDPAIVIGGLTYGVCANL